MAPARTARRLAPIHAALSAGAVVEVQAPRLPALATTDPACHDLDQIDMDPEAYRSARLTPAQRAQFREEGYILIKGVLNQAQVAELTDALDAEHETKTLEQQLRPDPSMSDAMNRM